MTYSIIGRDPDSGQMGVATQSHAFAVGSSVPWAMPGVGVIASQSMGEPMYGDLGLDMLRAGLTTTETLAALTTVDPYPRRRQVAMVDRDGNVDLYTGDDCVAHAGHQVGDGCAALANMMVSDTVWEAMVSCFEQHTGRLTQRLLAALHAAEDEGGDIRGVRSAAIVVVQSERSGRPWRDQVVDLRVDDHRDPLGELDRMVAFNARYHQMVEAFELALAGETAAALATIPQPPPSTDEPDLAIWRAVVLATAGELDPARALLASLAQQTPDFVETLRRFSPAGLLDPSLLDAIMPGASPQQRGDPQVN